ncbi:hypothetical protein GDO81_004940 [Engystomops pustulosus]|uniref:Maturase K n=1 Tax=Engystomops pustulosus TaxID=76066 RepID=A0AAV7CJJ4_ENGPU|nr:hypothetical protein GDO81_004940 [Engystomops pustulosus]
MNGHELPNDYYTSIFCLSFWESSSSISENPELYLELYRFWTKCDVIESYVMS